VRPADGFDIQFKKKKKKDKIGKKMKRSSFRRAQPNGTKSFSQSEDKNNF
jgi:hypothetical protein